MSTFTNSIKKEILENGKGEFIVFWFVAWKYKIQGLKQFIGLAYRFYTIL